jgi:AmpD protein
LFKWLLFIAVGYSFYLWLKGKKQAELRQQESLRAKADKPSAPVEPVKMVPCQYCKVHLPKSEAVVYEGRVYCSKEHLEGVDEQGWVGAANWKLSPNHDLRAENTEPDLVVIHHISLPPGQFRNKDSSQYIIDFFQNQLDPSVHPYFEEIADQKVSSHFLITRTGRLVQFVSTNNKAWHAGVSSFLGREKCNEFSIGIELEGDGDSAFEEAQYKTLATLVKALQARYTHLQFAGHSDIAPDRKTDPGIFFDWKKFQKETKISEKNLPYGLTSR